MNRSLAIVAALAVLLSAGSVHAAEQTVVLNVKNAYCALCLSIVKTSLTRVPGVKTVEIKQAGQTAVLLATVIFDDATTSVSALVAAPTNAGYPTQAVN
ncbi:MAG: cation transporter [Hyphomicrobiales bacterium]|nr:cation transporter [Hyphomicrobiales bacterium]